MDKIERIKDLIEKLNKASVAYYNTGNPVMSDAEYDLLYKELKKLEKETEIVLNTSPTQKVGAVVDSIKKITHNHPMLSLDKCHTEQEVEKFVGNKLCTASVKLDGLTVSATYNNGILTRLETRGNGTEGSDILFHKNSIADLPQTIDYKGEYVIDGECIIPTDVFEKINSKLADEEKFANPRNMASGALNLLDSNISATRGLHFVAWRVIKANTDENSYVERLVDATKLGFKIVPRFALAKFNISKGLQAIKVVAEENHYPYDGCVITYDDTEYGMSLGQTSHAMKHSIAYKFEDEEVETTLREIEWTMGKVGSLCPTAIFNTISIEGTDVSRASVHNISILKALELGIGDKITVYKANMIIPQIRENLTRSNNIIIPDVCPICGGKTEIINENGTAVLTCSNPSCKGKLLGKLTHFVSKAAMNIDGFSEATLEKFINLGWLNSFADIYRLREHKSEMLNLDSFGKKSVEKLLQSIEGSRTTDLAHFLNALSIPGCGKSTSKDIAQYCNGSIENFHLKMDLYGAIDFKNINGIGDSLVLSMDEWYRSIGLDIINELLNNGYVGIAIPQEKTDITESNVDLTGNTYVITGSLNYFENREILKELIESLGGKVSGSVSVKTTCLINNDVNSTSSKNQKAKSLGVSIWSEEQFLDSINYAY